MGTRDGLSGAIGEAEKGKEPDAAGPGRARRRARLQIRRYEGGSAQPTLDVIRRLALALSVSADALVFAKEERGPVDDDLRLQFEAVSRLDPEEQRIVKALIEGMILKHEAKRWSTF